MGGIREGDANNTFTGLIWEDSKNSQQWPPLSSGSASLDLRREFRLKARDRGQCLGSHWGHERRSSTECTEHIDAQPEGPEMNFPASMNQTQMKLLFPFNFLLATLKIVFVGKEKKKKRERIVSLSTRVGREWVLLQTQIRHTHHHDERQWEWWRACYHPGNSPMPLQAVSVLPNLLIGQEEV